MSRSRKKAKQREPETAEIDGISHDGKGIAAVEGKKVFVGGALQGETVMFQRRKRHRNYDEAELLEVIEASPLRIEPRCAAFGNCGGCSLQHLSPDDQRAIKAGTLQDNLERIGQVVPEEWLDPVFNPGTEGSWNYRRRARLGVKDVPAKGRVLVGFREAHAPYVCDMHRCEVLAQPVDGLLDALSELIGQLSIRARLPQIEVAVADNAATLLLRALDPPTDADTLLLRQFGVTHNVQIALQTGGLGTASPLDDSIYQALRYSLPEFDVEIEFRATDFVQVNAPVNRLMVAKAIELLQVSNTDRVLDLYCGIGNFSLPLARRAAAVLALEVEQQQVDRGRFNAAHNKIENCEFRTADLSLVDENDSWIKEDWDKVLLDPARSGAEAVVANMARIGPERIVYVSCHSGTLARDAGVLVREQGYRLSAAGIIDMFPHTGHVESIAVFEKVS
jgi:23S rRNA (uracil1939-C5)-methyltransferase